MSDGYTDEKKGIWLPPGARPNAKYDAPEGAIWVCAACGKYSSNRIDGLAGSLWDESCFLHAVLCFADVTTDPRSGRVTAARAWPRGESEP